MRARGREVLGETSFGELGMGNRRMRFYEDGVFVIPVCFVHNRGSRKMR